MGIQGLLPALKSTTRGTNVKEYAGMRAAVDTYSWLHKAAFMCSKDICHGKTTPKFIDYCMHRVNLLRHHGVKPLLVFDGGKLPIKSEQEEKRSRTRKEHLQRALDFEASGNHAAAYDSYQKAVDITPAIAFQLIEVLRNQKVDFIVAPYEADAQLAYLSLSGHVDVVITEDSDLVAYGCPRILFKMDKFGQGVELQFADLVKSKELNFTNFTKRMVLEMCIFSGCDYLASLPGMGIKRAHNLIKRFRSYEKVIRHMRFSGVTVPKIYEENFEKAVRTFCHQLVYDPVLEDIINLTDIPEELENANLDFLGPKLSKTLVKQIADGLIDPLTRTPFQESLSPCTPLESVAACFEMPKLNGRRKEPKQLDLPAQKNVLTNYFISKTAASKQQFKSPRQAGLPEGLGSQECLIPSPSSQEDFNMDHVPVTPDEELQREATDLVEVKHSAHSRELKDVATKLLSRSPYFPAAEEESVENDENQAAQGESNYVHCIRQNMGIGNQRKRRATVDCNLGSSGSCKKRQSNVMEAAASKFSSVLLGADINRGVSLSAKVCHVQEYSSIAQASLDKFTATMSPFKCTSGARVSGLRAPLKHKVVNRSSSQTDNIFKEFALTQS